jgi:hypothetical protein
VTSGAVAGAVGGESRHGRLGSVLFTRSARLVAVCDASDQGCKHPKRSHTSLLASVAALASESLEFVHEVSPMSPSLSAPFESIGTLLEVRVAARNPTLSLGWSQVLIWVIDWETRRALLSTQAFESGRYPGALYRTVRRVTGADWSQVQARGSLWVLLELIARCRAADPRAKGGKGPNRVAS